MNGLILLNKTLRLFFSKQIQYRLLIMTGSEESVSSLSSNPFLCHLGWLVVLLSCHRPGWRHLHVHIFVSTPSSSVLSLYMCTYVVLKVIYHYMHLCEFETLKRISLFTLKYISGLPDF